MHLTESIPSAWQETVLRLAPQLYLDRIEPFLPIRAGVSVYEETRRSDSFDRTIQVDSTKVKAVIEYAIYYDYDIQHLYDLEHVWVYVGHEDEIVSVEASFHGRYFLGVLPDRSNLIEGRGPRLYSQPGKHAMSPQADLFLLIPNVTSCCTTEAGDGGLLEPDLFAGEFKHGDNIDQIAEEHLRTFSFEPTFDYVPFEWPADAFVSWEALRKEIPVRMRKLVAEIQA
ncbi:hypothetical protein [Paenibacillus pinihumi]|uniref:hypothetical protein n=1 Tax=Paenibacillus pinihumi TaxID=669462 RepID=UPI00040E41F1|nr:hypothetical protein [Paenibacillus pinihumi]